MYKVDSISTATPLEVKSSNDLHYNTLTMGFTNNHHISYIADLPSKLVQVVEFGSVSKYQLADGFSGAQSFIPTTLPHNITTGAAAVSPDGRWIIAEVMGAGLIKIDTKTRELVGFSNYRHSYGYGSDAHMQFVATRDANYIAAFDYNITPTVYSLNEDCVIKSDVYTEEFAEKLRQQSCPTDEHRLHSALQDKYANQARGVSATKFNASGDTLYFDRRVYDEIDWSVTAYRTPLRAGNYVAEESIQYMTLGDSFTSGEGDIEKKDDGSTYYLPGTEGKNECHISSRSYPFLLRDHFGVDGERMRSVACSGAQVLPDYIGPSDSYTGQGGRLGYLSATNLGSAKKQALEEFTPGHVRQIEFIERYQPKTVTLMGGGNDVGFGAILEYCASPSWQGIFVDDTCGYAKEGHVLRDMLAQSIKSQQSYTKMLLRAIKQISPETKVYVVGYPSFISENRFADCLNSAALDDDERVMIHEGVTFMNSKLQSAAQAEGARYVDIQDVLEGGRLCEGSKYVTGLMDIGFNMEDYGSELFHPNAAAHRKIAQKIISSDFHIDLPLTTELGLSSDLPISTYFGAPAKIYTAQRTVTSSVLVEQSKNKFSLERGSLSANSAFTLTFYSSKINLGQYTADENGAVDIAVELPGIVSPGRHVLVLNGLSPSGEPMQYFQFITVVSTVSGDADNDGIPDTDDLCLFVSVWIDEATGDDICLAPVSSADDQDSGAPVVDIEDTLHSTEPVITEKPTSEESFLQSPSGVKKVKNSNKKPATSAEGSVTATAMGNKKVALGHTNSQTVSKPITRVQESPAPVVSSKKQPRQAIVTPNVLGVTRTNVAKDSEANSERSVWVLVVVISFSTLLVTYGIVKVIRRSYDR